MANLSRYGGNSFEANLAIAAQRAALIRSQLETVITLSTDPFGLSLRAKPDPRGILGAAISDVEMADLLSLSSGEDPRDLLRRTSPAGRDIANNMVNMSFFLEFLRNDDPSKDVNTLVDAALLRGINFIPRIWSPMASVIGSISTPMRALRSEDGQYIGGVEPAISTSEYSDALQKLSTFMDKNGSPHTLRGDKIHIKIAGTQEEFESFYSAISPTKRDLSQAGGINIMTRLDGKELTVTDAVTGNTLGASQVILINNALTSKSNGTFTTPNATGETLIHEYGHSLHRSIDPLWGHTGERGKIDSNYESAFAKDISEYGKNNHQEHFAESFANYVLNGTATDEFKDFLKNTLGMVDIGSIELPDALNGTKVADDFVKWMNNADLDGYKFVLESATDPIQTMSQSERAALARSGRGTFVFTLKGYFLDPQGRTVRNPDQTVMRTFTWTNGTLTVHHDFFKLPDAYQGSGLGTKFIKESFKYYQSIGLESVDVYAALDNGPYQWGLVGFDFMSDMQRVQAAAEMRGILQVFEAYRANRSSYESMDVSDVVAGIRRENPTISYGIYDISQVIEQIRFNGWEISDQLLSEMRALASLSGSVITANMLANIGRKNKRTTDKTTSTVGRYIMMRKVGPWNGILQMADWKDEDEEK